MNLAKPLPRYISKPRVFFDVFCVVWKDDGAIGPPLLSAADREAPGAARRVHPISRRRQPLLLIAYQTRDQMMTPPRDERLRRYCKSLLVAYNVLLSGLAATILGQERCMAK